MQLSFWGTWVRIPHSPVFKNGQNPGKSSAFKGFRLFLYVLYKSRMCAIQRYFVIKFVMDLSREMSGKKSTFQFFRSSPFGILFFLHHGMPVHPFHHMVRFQSPIRMMSASGTFIELILEAK